MTHEGISWSEKARSAIKDPLNNSRGFFYVMIKSESTGSQCEECDAVMFPSLSQTAGSILREKGAKCGNNYDDFPKTSSADEEKTTFFVLKCDKSEQIFLEWVL